MAKWGVPAFAVCHTSRHTAKVDAFAVCPDAAHLCRVPRSGPRQRAKRAAAGAGGTAARPAAVGRGRHLADGRQGPAPRPQFVVCLRPGTRQRPRLPCAIGMCTRQTFSNISFQIFIRFLFKFFSFSLVFYLMFKTLSHFLITSLKVTGQFMFYLDIAIISCVANKYLISKKNINIPLI